MRTRTFTTANHEAAAAAALAAIRARRGAAHVVNCRDFSDLRVIHDPAAGAVDAHIGSLANATLEPLTAAPHSDGSHVTLDARNVDHWSRNHAR
jgi:hypothetical protein